MKTFQKIIFFLIVLSVVPVYGQTAKRSFKVEGFNHPESVVMDEQKNVLYVSNIGENSEGDGFISKVTPEGEITELKWITGLNDPKGLLISGNKLYVTDVTQLVEMSIDNARIIRKIPVEGAQSLNDITIDAAGSIFVSDLAQSSIYFIPGDKAASSMAASSPGGEIKEYIKSEELDSPNGLWAQGDDLYVASWGENKNGNFLKIDMDLREIDQITKDGLGNLDGIQPSGEGAFYVSDWATGTIYKINKEGNFSKILTSDKSSGDLLFLKEKNQLIIPMNFQNEIWWYQLD